MHATPVSGVDWVSFRVQGALLVLDSPQLTDIGSGQSNRILACSCGPK